MMRSNFILAFKVEVLHSYFEQNVCNCLCFHPGEATGKLMKRYGIRIRNMINGFGLYVNSRASLTAFLNYIEQAASHTSFDFEIENNNSTFSFFTALPVDWIGYLVYDSHAGSNVYEGGVVQLSASLSPETGTTFLGKLTLHFDDILKFRGDQEYAQFVIRFQARATQWQYYVINKSSVPLGNPVIIGKNDIEFDGPQRVTIETGQQAIVFTSGVHLIPLSEVPRYKFDLVNAPPLNGDPAAKKSPKIIIKGLPNPDPKRIGIIRINAKEQVSSPMYVYV